MDIISFHTFEAQARPRGISVTRKLQYAVPLVDQIAVLSKVGNHVHDQFLHHNFGSPFRCSEAQARPPGIFRKTVTLSQTDAFSKIHAVFSDGLAECGKQLFHAVTSPFPGHLRP